MTDHPEQHLINILIMGDLAGVDEDNWEEVKAASDKISVDGHKEYERQRDEALEEIRKDHEKEMKYIHMLGAAIDDGRRH